MAVGRTFDHPLGCGHLGQRKIGPIDLVTGDHFLDVGAGSLAAIAGYPHLSVPMGAVEGLPVGLSIMGAKWDDARVLKAGAAYERARSVAVPTPRLKRWGE